MQDTIDCNKINKIKEERMQTQFYTGSANSVPMSSTQRVMLSNDCDLTRNEGSKIHIHLLYECIY